MGLAPEVSLVVKHTFLEYIFPEGCPKEGISALSDTELLESAGLISISPTSAAARAAKSAADGGALEELAPQTKVGVVEASPAFRPMPSMHDGCWPVTPMLDAVFEPAGYNVRGSGIDFIASAELKAVLGINGGDCGMLAELAEGDLWLPDAAQPDGTEGQIMFQAPWLFMPYAEYCCGWQDPTCWGGEVGMWPPSTSSTASGDAESVAGSSETDGMHIGELRTTVMLRNLPKTFSREMLLRKLDSMGFAGQYDFVYVPVDFSTGMGLGYAFINMSMPGTISKIWEEFDGMYQWEMECDNVCTVSWSDPHQGLAAHIERYQNSPVMHPEVPDEWKPALFMHGMRVDFPPATKKIKAPKVRSKKTEVVA